MVSTEISAAMTASATGELLAAHAERAAQRQVSRRRTMLLGMTALGLLVSFLVVALTPTEYEASGRLQMFLRSAPASRQGRLSKQGLEDVREQMLGRTFLTEVVERLSPEDRTRLLKGGKVRPGKHAASQFSEMATDALAGFRIEIDPNTDMMSLTEAGEDPRLTAAVVTAAMAAAQDVGLRLRMEETSRVSAVLGQRLEDVARDIRLAQMREDEAQRRTGRLLVAESHRSAKAAVAEASTAFMNKKALRRAKRMRQTSAHVTAQLDEQGPEPDEILGQISEALHAATLVRRLEETRAQALAQLHAEGQDAVLEGQAEGQDREEVERLRLLLQRQQTEVATRAQVLGAASPEMLQSRAALEDVKRQLQAEDRHVVDVAEARAREAKVREGELQEELNRRKELATAEAQAESEDQMAELSLAVDEDVYAAQTEVLRSAQVNEALKASGFYVLDRPQVPRERAGRKYGKALAVGFSGGVLLGILGALFLYAVEGQNWHPAQVEEGSGMNMVGALPLRRGEGRVAKGRRELPDFSSGLFGSALTELGERVAASRGGGQGRVVLLASSTAGEGTTTAAAGLAMRLARSGHRVLLMEANGFHPGVSRMFGLSAQRGLGQVLRGELGLGEAVQGVGEVAGLDVLVAGPLAGQSLQPGMNGVLAEAERLGYGWVVVDGAPVIGSPETVALARRCDVFLLVTRYGRVALRSVRHAARLLQHAAPAESGVLVNGIPG